MCKRVVSGTVLTPLLHTIARLAVLAGIGFLLFRPRVSQARAYPVFLFAVLKVMLPIYFAHRIPSGWESAVGLGAPLLLFFFVLCLAMLILQAWLGGAVVRTVNRWARRRGRDPIVRRPTDFVVLFALHNAGFLPIPILERLVPEPIFIATFFYVLAFNLTFWSVVVPIIEQGTFSLRTLRVRLSPSLIGMIVGFTLATTGLFRFVPDLVTTAAERIGAVALDAILVALGGALAGIREKIRIEREHLLFLIVRLGLYPAAIFLIAALPWPGFRDPEFAWAMRAFLVLQATMPPATQTMVLTRSLATEDAVHYTGQITILSYLFSLAAIPLFIAFTIATFAN